MRQPGQSGVGVRTAMPLDVRLAIPALAAWLTAWQVRALASTTVLVLAAVLLVVGVLLLRLRARATSIAAAVCICSAAACVAVASRSSVRSAEPLPTLAERGSAVTVIGTLADDPRRVTSPGPGGRRELYVATVRAERLEWAGRVVRMRVPVLVMSADQGWSGLLPSQQVKVEGRLRPVDSGDDVAAILSGRGPPAVLSRPTPVQRSAGELRAGLRRAVAPLPDDAGGLLPGLVVGDTSNLDSEVKENFRTVGLTHLTAVSGTNVSIVLLAALLLARTVGVPLQLRPAVAAAALLGFVVLARPSPSVLRAAAMGLVGLLALSSGTRQLAMPALSGGVLALILLAPDLAAAPGFALSVLATAGLLILAPPWRDWLAQRMPGALADALAVPAAAQVACGPVVVAISGQVGLLSIPANLLAVPAVAPATLLGVLAALLAPIALPVAQCAAWVAYLPTAWLVLLADRGATLPGANLPWPDGHRGAALLTVATALGFVLLRRQVIRRATAAVAAGGLVAAAGMTATGPTWPPTGWFMVSCDVGQGDAHVLRAGDGAAVVVDVGPDPALVDACLRRLDVTVVPFIVLTHAHADHVDGLPGALNGRQVGRIEVGPLADPIEQHEAVLSQAAGARVPTVQALLGEVRRLGPLTWEVLAPGRPFHGTNSDPNNSSVVVRVEVGGARVLLTGDVEPEAQRALLASGVDLRADVLKVPHHGSRHQAPEFLDATQARVAVTSVGADNTYRHPDPGVLGRLIANGARSYRTDLDGDVALALRDGRLIASGRDGDGTVEQESASTPDGKPAAVAHTPGRAAQPVPRGSMAGWLAVTSWCRSPWSSGTRGCSSIGPSPASSRQRGPPMPKPTSTT